MKQRELVVPLLVTALSLAGIAGRIWLFSRHETRAVAAEPKDKIFTAQEERQYRHITNGIVQTGTIGDKDLRYLLRLIDTPAAPGATDTEKSLRKTMCLVYLTKLKAVTPAQRDWISATTLHILSEPDRSSRGVNYQFACRTIALITRDKKAVPVLRELCKDPRPIIQKHAQVALQLLGYKA